MSTTTTTSSKAKVQPKGKSGASPGDNGITTSGSTSSLHNIACIEMKEWDRQGWFEQGKVYRVEFNPRMELHPMGARHLLL